MRSDLWRMIGAAIVLAGCAAGTAESGADAAGGAGGSPLTEDAGFEVPPPTDRGPPAECAAGDSQPCDLAEGCVGLQVCVGGMWGPCVEIEELCNGADDDCDGSTDEGFGGLGQQCAAGRGACQVFGDNVCAENGRGVVCGAAPVQPGSEVCNAIDDDCDGLTDEEAACPESEAACNDGVDDDGDGAADCLDDDCAGSPDCQGDPEDCAAPGDEDGDGRADCDDLDCADFEDCRPPAIEICDEDGDEDGDGAADCDDPDCAGFVACVPPPEEDCAIRGDEDGDGDFDCNDADCAGHPNCGPPPDEQCDVRGDEDGDGLFDCLDDDCEGHPACAAPTEICDRAGDEDGDNLRDCADPDCEGHPACAPMVEVCDVAGDEDGDGRADCDDPDCADHVLCRDEICDVAGDEDGDGDADCDDADCAGHPACRAGPEICDVIGDEDRDGAADCDDPDCARHPFCAPPVERCDVVGDEDGDGDADCDDSDCADDPRCAPPVGEAVPIAGPGGTIDLEGALDGASPRWARPSEECDPGAGGHPYRQHRIVNQTGEPQIIAVFAVWDGDGYLHAYNEPFDAADLDGCVTGNDDAEGIGPDASEMFLIIPAGVTVSLIASTSAAGDEIGPYAIEVATLGQQRVAAPGGESITLSGSIDADDPLWARRNLCGAADAEVDHHYDVYEVFNSGAAEIRVTATAAWSGDGYLHWFTGSLPFDPVADAGRCGGANDDLNGDLEASQVANVPIPGGGSVLFVGSTFSGGAAIGAYTITVQTQ